MQDGPLKKLRGNDDSIFRSSAPLNKFKLYSKEAFICDKCMMSSFRYDFTWLFNLCLIVIHHRMIADMTTDSKKANSDISMFQLPVLSSSRRGSHYSGWNTGYFA